MRQADAPVHVSDVYATISHALGCERNARVEDSADRPHFFIEGSPVRTLF